jgi:predicted RecA/RadA family phage recombinase
MITGCWRGFARASSIETKRRKRIMIKNYTSKFLPVILLVAVIATAFAATNYVQPGDAITLTFGTTSPLANQSVVQTSGKALGGIVGVALDGTGVASENVTVATKGVFKCSVTASSTVGNIQRGDFIYTAVPANAEVCTTVLSNINSGLLYGVALEGTTASTTAGVYATISVMLRQPGHL